MKRICLPLLLALLLLVSSCALAQKTGGTVMSAKKEFNIWDVDFDNLDPEDEERIER